jgi:hypothetical protein
VTSRLEKLLVGWRQRILWTSQEPDELPGRGQWVTSLLNRGGQQWYRWWLWQRWASPIG